MKVLYEKDNKKYSLIEKQVFEFLEPTRGDILIEAFLFRKFINSLKESDINFELDETLYISVENEKHLYLIVLDSNYLEYYISNGDEEEKDEVAECLGFLAGYLKVFRRINNDY